MTTPASGSIAVSHLSSECGFSASVNISLNHEAFNCMRGTAGTPISMTQFYSKTNRGLTVGAGTNVGFYDGWLGGTPYGSLAIVSSGGLTIKQLESRGDGIGSLILDLNGTLPPGAFSYLGVGLLDGSHSAIYAEAAAGTRAFDMGGVTRWSWTPPFFLVADNGKSAYVFIH